MNKIMQTQRIIARHEEEKMSEKIYKTTKGLLAKPEPEPEAWMLIDKGTGARIPRAYKPEREVNKDRWKLYPLYAVPPKREPLSDEAICEILLKKEWKGFVELVRQVENFHGVGVSDE